MKSDSRGLEEYRNDVWKVLVNQFFGKWINPDDTILDLGCGYGEFINHTNAKVKHAMDLNPRTRKLLKDDVIFMSRTALRHGHWKKTLWILFLPAIFLSTYPIKKLWMTP